MQDADLTPCLWCQSRAGTIRDNMAIHDDDYRYYVVCKACGARGPSRLTRDDAGIVWNDFALSIQAYKNAVHAALHRYDRPDEKHNKEGGFPRGELAWAMADDLRRAV